MNVRITLITLGDVDKDLRDQLAKLTLDPKDSRQAPPPGGQYRSYLHECLYRGTVDTLLFIAWKGAMPVGWAVYADSVIAIFVNPAHRRRGIGTAIVNKVYEYVIQKVRVHAVIGSVGSKEFYESLPERVRLISAATPPDSLMPELMRDS